MKRFLVGAAVGAIAMYFLDPDRGRSRRAQLKQQGRAKERSLDRFAHRVERDAENRAQGEQARAHGAGVFHPTDDRSLEVHLHQVLKELDLDIRDVTVEAVEGHVRLRGQVASAIDMKRVESAVHDVPGVHEVESFMHLPGQPAPNKEPAREAGTSS